MIGIGYWLLACAWQRLAFAWQRLAFAWQRLAFAWQRLDCRFGPRSETLSSLGKYGDKAPSDPFSLFFPRAAPPSRLAPSYPQAERPDARIHPQNPVDNSILSNLPVNILWTSTNKLNIMNLVLSATAELSRAYLQNVNRINDLRTLSTVSTAACG